MKKGSRQIILNWMLPAIPSFPSPAMSVLKSQLQAHGYEVKVVYWNFHLMPVVEHYWGKTIDDNDDHLVYYLSPFFGYLALDMEDSDSIERQRDFWNKAHKDVPKSKAEFRLHLQENVAMLKRAVVEVAKIYGYEGCLFTGFYQKLFQMYGADIIARELRCLFPNMVTVLGGIDTKDEAIASMDNFSVFDYALWGEGEFTLLRFIEGLEGQLSKEDVGNFAWREDDKICTSKMNRQFLNLDDALLPDYSDYFEQACIKQSKIRLPIEGSRGCHWAQCRFCFHNEGVRYRRKSPKVIASEIRTQIAKYGIQQISFLDNDTIGRDLSAFNALLDELIAIRHDYPEFNITRAEVVTRHTNADIVQKMVMAGFKDVQIGYESLSDSLLTAIHKCNSFSSNFLFVKWAMVYGIKIRGANLIMNMLEETEENLQESLQNLYFLRFILSAQKFIHIYTTLWIKRSSKYFKTLERHGELGEWTVFKSFRALPQNYIKERNKYSLQFFVKPDFHPLWDDIEYKEWELIKQYRTYTIIEKGSGYYYREYTNDQMVENRMLDRLDWEILCMANRRLVELVELKEALCESIDKIALHLSGLKDLGILYYYGQYQQIVSILNTDSLNKLEKQRYT